MNRKVLDSTLHILCKILKMFFIWKFFWLTAKTKTETTERKIFSDNLSPYQENLFHLSHFSRQPVALSEYQRFCSTWFLFLDTLSEDGNALDHFSQTVCQKFRELAPIEKTFTEKLWNRFN